MGNTPVIGWDRTISYTKGRKNPKSITEHTSFSLRAWEVAALFAVTAAGWWLLTTSGDNKNPPPISTPPTANDTIAFFLGGPLGYAVAKGLGV